jgi:predicted metal-binding transcription factor (methanogenesis marker protein 9)
MGDKVTLKLTTAAAAYVRKDTPKETKLKAARGEFAVSEGDLGTLLFFLGHDPDSDVRKAAVKSLAAMPESQLLAISDSLDTHPKVLDMLARFHYEKQEVAKKLLSHPEIESETLAFLVDKGVEMSEATLPEQTGDEGENAGAMDDIEEVDEDSEEFKYQLSMKMEVPEKIKMAMIGDKEWRILLLKDANKVVSGSVLKNPRITEPEILAIANSTISNEEIMRVISKNKDWIKSYQIRKALVMNCKTPLQAALKFLSTFTEKDLSMLAKSKNVSTVLATQARRLLLTKNKH